MAVLTVNSRAKQPHVRVKPQRVRAQIQPVSGRLHHSGVHYLFLIYNVSQMVRLSREIRQASHIA